MSGADRRWLLAAIELSRSCPVATTAYAVGAIVVGADGGELSRGYSREADPADHAEESALSKPALTGVDLRRATIYTSLEPCSTRRSRARSCTELILTAASAGWSSRCASHRRSPTAGVRRRCRRPASRWSSSPSWPVWYSG